jgi:hypothetical protein
LYNQPPPPFSDETSHIFHHDVHFFIERRHFSSAERIRQPRAAYGSQRTIEANDQAISIPFVYCDASVRPTSRRRSSRPILPLDMSTTQQVKIRETFNVDFLRCRSGFLVQNALTTIELGQETRYDSKEKFKLSCSFIVCHDRRIRRFAARFAGGQFRGLQPGNALWDPESRHLSPSFLPRPLNASFGNDGEWFSRHILHAGDAIGRRDCAYGLAFGNILFNSTITWGTSRSPGL